MVAYSCYLDASLSGIMYSAKFVVTSRHQKGMCYDENGLCAQNKDIVVGWTVNTTGTSVLVLREIESSL